ncbi:TIGR02679 family protein [Pseudoxanthomonas winnipegensis]|uniref:TIGR02679 family protein n=1 Tax=Pseudoxanthomonas winnipegensis TaxID=2480810 RepID=UPI0030F4701E
MSTVVDPRLQRLLGGPELAAVRQRLRRRFERAEPDAALESVRLDELDPDAHRALCQLSGRPSRLSRSMTLDVADLDVRLRAAGLADSLRDALERLDGPIVPHARLRREREARWRVVADAAGPMLRAWLKSSPAALGVLKRLSRDPERGAGLLAAADAVLAHLPAAGMPRSQLAAETLGDAHALDPGRPVASLVLAAWRHGEGQAGDELSAEADPEQLDEPPATGQEAAAERLREVWARAGVSVSELARPALFLNLPMPVGGPHTWVAGEPGYLSLRQLLRQPPVWPVSGRWIHVCENPDIVAIAADRVGAGCAPLVCTDGMPAAAQRVLLDQLAAAGARLCYHGDYDWPGIGIGNFVMRTWQASPWRFGAVEYRAAVGQAPSRPRDLGAARIEALWDARLTAAMHEHGLVVAEEAVAQQLLDDLGRDAGG